MHKKGCKVVAIDYLQLMRGDGGDKQSRVQEVAEISRGLKAIARSTDALRRAQAVITFACSAARTD